MIELETPKQKAMFFGSIAVLAVCLIWMIYFIATSRGFYKEAKKLETPGWKLVTELNQKLNAEHDFVDTQFIVESESPLSLKVVGAVRTKAAYERLKSFLKELRPEGDYELDIVEPTR
jgi:hypothetical protein